MILVTILFGGGCAVIGWLLGQSRARADTEVAVHELRTREAIRRLVRK